jgi:hypothetical protein
MRILFHKQVDMLDDDMMAEIRKGSRLSGIRPFGNGSMKDDVLY